MPRSALGVRGSRGSGMRLHAQPAASVRDVATAAGVSVGTVSNVLNRPDRVGAAARARVEQAMADLGFVRNESARQLRTGTSRTLAYVMLDAGNPFFTDVARGVEAGADRARLSLVLSNSGNSAVREAAHLALLEQQRVQGVLVTPVDPDAPGLVAIAARGTPLVVVDRAPRGAGLCSVAVDDRYGARLVIEHLVDRGHERVAFVGGPAHLGQVHDRLVGARRAWADAGLPARDLVVLGTQALSVPEGRAAGQRLGGLPTRRRPTAAFCGNDLLALGLLQHAISTGVRVPEELALVGYDDIDFAGAAAVPLTSVRQPRHELGRTAAELVLDEAGNLAHQHRQVLFTPELVARASTMA